ncbi:MAG: prepilin-type N-terminal cleavage/methylation domain-containing protein [Pseudomonadota bacterium]
MRPGPAQRRAGFSVIEVLASVALLAIALVPLFQLQSALAEAAVRLELAAEIAEMEESALALISAVNPIEQNEGADQLGDWSMRWRAEPVTEEVFADGYLGQSNFNIALFEITVTLERGDTRRQFAVRQLGWRVVRSEFGELDRSPQGG